MLLFCCMQFALKYALHNDAIDFDDSGQSFFGTVSNHCDENL